MQSKNHKTHSFLWLAGIVIGLLLYEVDVYHFKKI